MAFLLGSGISIPARMPGMAEITDRILSGKNVMHHSNQTFHFREPLFSHLRWQNEHVPRVTDFLKILKHEIDAYYSKYPERIANYEDLYYVAYQIYGCETGLLPNPTAGPLIDRVRKRVQHLFKPKSYEFKQH